eukprot:GHVL01005980.1.p3 GENE.GHVL01005980.1~~GHVL01005980.1.p3  ORF type:complete len:123 (+),score=10.60 GHVL01005980.1:973-1341(+)
MGSRATQLSSPRRFSSLHLAGSALFTSPVQHSSPRRFCSEVGETVDNSSAPDDTLKSREHGNNSYALKAGASVRRHAFENDLAALQRTVPAQKTEYLMRKKRRMMHFSGRILTNEAERCLEI